MCRVPTEQQGDEHYHGGNQPVVKLETSPQPVLPLSGENEYYEEYYYDEYKEEFNEITPKIGKYLSA